MLLKRQRRILLVAICLTLLVVSSGSVPNASCQDCPETHLSEGNFIKCLSGQSAHCESGPKCECRGSRKKDNQCGGACGVRTNWGACSIQCQQGTNATCVQGRKEWIGLQQILIKPRCECGGSGSVSAVPSPEAEEIALTGPTQITPFNMSPLASVVTPD
jgi:hypothetical protein